MNYSRHQRAIFKEVLTSSNNILVKATAGSGKTTTLVEISKLLPSELNSIFVAFNRSIVEELGKRLPPKFKVSTLHSLGNNMLFRTYGSAVKVNEKKSYRLAGKLFANSDLPPTTIAKSKYDLANAWNMVRVTLTDIRDTDAIEALFLKYELPVSVHEFLAFHSIVDLYNNRQNLPSGSKYEIDFTDMVYLPVTLAHVITTTYDLVMIDECQDLNLCQHALLDRITSQRIISVGDPYQAIYGFSGADSNSFSKFTERNNTTCLPLSVSYRCAKRIVEEAQKYSPEITTNSSSPEGVVDWKGLDCAEAGDFVLCRNNDPLIEAYFDLIDQGKKAYIIGDELVGQYLKIVRPFKNRLLSSFFFHLDNLLESIKEQLFKKGVRVPSNTEVYQKQESINKALKILAARVSTVSQLIDRIQDIFHPQKNSIILSSIHKSKGLEADRVFLLRWDLIPSKFAKTRESLIQEKNLQFVAITRAKRALYFVPYEEQITSEKDSIDLMAVEM
ncbi:MAG: UvrD-helicase domain-containing protein [Bacteroidota bacterium]